MSLIRCKEREILFVLDDEFHLSVREQRNCRIYKNSRTEKRGLNVFGFSYLHFINRQEW